MRRRGSLLALLLAAVWALLATGVASAHSVLESSDPADGATLTTAPTSVTLTFNETIQNFEPTILVTGPNGNRYAAGPATARGPQVSVGLVGAGPAGRWTIAYRIVSADGHPVSGELHYTLAASAAGTVAGTPPAASTGSADGAGGTPVWLWIGIGVAALVLVAAGVVFLRRPQQD